jgi:hypothetical protein
MATTKVDVTAQVQGALPVANGGTGDATLTAHAVLLGEGTSGVAFATIGTAGRVLTDNGAGADPTFQAPAAVPNFVDSEVPSGTINGTNVTFTLANTPTSGSLHLYLNGVRQTPTSDYSISTNTITMVAAPNTGDVLLADYRH